MKDNNFNIHLITTNNQLASDFIRLMKRKIEQRVNEELTREPVATIPANFYAEEFYQAVPLLRKHPKKVRDAFFFILSSVIGDAYLPNFNFYTHFQQPH